MKTSKQDVAKLKQALETDGHEDLSAELDAYLALHAEDPNPETLAVIRFMGVDKTRMPMVLEVLAS